MSEKTNKWQRSFRLLPPKISEEEKARRAEYVDKYTPCKVCKYRKVFCGCNRNNK